MANIRRTLYELVKGKKAYLKKKKKKVKKATKKADSVYFKGIKRKQSYEDQLRAAGIDWKRDRPTAKLKRKKK